jgi:IMP dehydrogenase
MLAGTDETPGKIEEIYKDGKSFKFKVFRGMASKEAQDDFMGKMAEWKTAEGVSVEIPCKGPVKNIIQDVVGGLRSGLTYSGATDIKSLQRKAQFIEVSQAGYKEGTPHAIGRLT